MEVVLYSYPEMDGVEIGREALDALADNPRIIGIKESSRGRTAGFAALRTAWPNRFAKWTRHSGGAITHAPRKSCRRFGRR